MCNFARKNAARFGHGRFVASAHGVRPGSDPAGPNAAPPPSGRQSFRRGRGYPAAMVTRRRLLLLAGGTILGARAQAALADPTGTIAAARFRSAHPFAGDGPLLTTVTPGGLPGRESATLELALSRRAHVVVDVVDRNAPGLHAGAAEGVTAGSAASLETLLDRQLGRGVHTVTWTPDAGTPPATYSLVVTASDARGDRVVLGAASPAHPHLPAAPVVRVLGLDAVFAKRGYRPGEQAQLLLAASARTVTAQIFRCGPETVPTYANNVMNGVAASAPFTVAWSGNANAPSHLAIPIGDWASGVYYVQLTSDDGRVGFAPFVLLPAQPSARIAVVVPTNTWQAYNFYDADGDGFGDSWYVSLATSSIDLLRPHLHRGVPYRFRSYDLAFLHWLAQTGKEADFYSDDDLGDFASGDALRAAYDLVVFPGHEEYVTKNAYDVVERYRDLGGNIACLSANNFFRRVDPHGTKLHLVGLWREENRPEAALLGAEYRASDRGHHQHPFVVTEAGAAAGWPFAGTNLVAGSAFGLYGIEIDATSVVSPPGTQVLAEIPDALGPGLTAQMTYYETPAGARVFDAGALNFGGQVLLWPQATQLLENVWARLAQP